MGSPPTISIKEGVSLKNEFELAPIGPDDDEIEVKPPVEFPAFTPAIVLPKPKPRVRPTMNFGEVYKSKSRIKYVIDGLLPTKGLMYIGARSGTGKTILAIQIAVDLIFDRETMTLKRGKDLPPQKILIISLEMGQEEMTARLIAMYPEFSEEDLKILSDSIELYVIPEPFRLWTEEHLVDLIHLIRFHKATGVLIDSASVSFAQSLKDDAQVNQTIANLYMVRNRLENWMIIISHTRKLPAGIVGNMEDITVDELFGHSGVAQSASSILLMHHDKKDSEGKDGKNKIVWLMNLKSRFGPEFPPFKMFLPTSPPLLFRRRDPIPLQPLSPEKRKEANRLAKEMDFGAGFKDIDFGSIGGVDDD